MELLIINGIDHEIIINRIEVLLHRFTRKCFLVLYNLHRPRFTFGSRYSRKDHVKFIEDSLNFPQILLGPFLNNLTHY